MNIPFYAMALANCRFLYTDIDNAYKKKKEKYYACAKKSEFYNSIMGKELSLLAEEYFKKCVGMLEYIKEFSEEDSQDTFEDIFMLFKKGYRKVYLYLKRYDGENKIDAEFFFHDYLGKSYQFMSDDGLTSTVVAAIFWGNAFDNMYNFEFLITMLQEQWVHYQGERRLNLDNIPDELNVKAEMYKKQVPKKIWDNILISSDNGYHGYDFLFDLEHLSHLSIFNELKFGEKEIKEVVLSYICAKEYCGLKESFDEYIHHALFMLGMCKAYNNVKEVYFANNKETMYVELDELKGEVSKYKSLFEQEKARNLSLDKKENLERSQLLSENETLQRENRRLLAQIDQMQKDSKELIALRDYVFAQHSENDILDSAEIRVDISALNKLKGVIIGGHPNWQNKLKEKLITWTFIDVDVSSVSVDLIKGADIVIFNTGYLKHSLYYTVMNVVRNENNILGYVSSTNIEMVLKEIWKIYRDINNK